MSGLRLLKKLGDVGHENTCQRAVLLASVSVHVPRCIHHRSHFPGDLAVRPAAHGRRMSGRQTQGVEALRGQPGVARQHGVEHPIEPASDIPVEPPLAARGTLVHRDLEHDGDPAVTFAEFGPLDRVPVALIAAFAAHTRPTVGRHKHAR